MMDASAYHAIDIHVKLGVFGEKLELLVQHLQALLRNLVRQDIVDRDLQVFQAGAIEAPDAVGNQHVAVGDHAGDHAAPPNAGDDQVEVGVQEWFAAGYRDDGRAQVCQVIESLVH